ncbi:MAG: transcription termination/antitermination protein NusG [Actinobacteria bacterium]|nr:transcription termination/antitermination protein NusG [Actinomycetota bacterium]
MFSWYAINTYSGHENKVKQNLEHRVVSMNQKTAIRRIVIPTETVTEMKDNQKVEKEVRTMPGYLLVNMELNEDSWGVVKGTPGVTGFVGSQTDPVPLAQSEVDRLLANADLQVSVGAGAGGGAGGGAASRQTPVVAAFSIGETVKVVSGPLSDFSGEIAEINEDAHKLKVLVSIFGRETPVEVGYDQVKKVS